MRRRPLLSLALSMPLAAGAATPRVAKLPYDEAADPRADINTALQAVHGTSRRVLVLFGANWCEDCRALSRALATPRGAKLLAREFEVVKVDVGRFDRHLDISKALGDPIAKGIPAAAVLAADGQVRYATKMGELSNARRMSATGIFDFFEGMARRSR